MGKWRWRGIVAWYGVWLFLFYHGQPFYAKAYGFLFFYLIAWVVDTTPKRKLFLKEYGEPTERLQQEEDRESNS